MAKCRKVAWTEYINVIRNVIISYLVLLCYYWIKSLRKNIPWLKASSSSTFRMPSLAILRMFMTIRLLACIVIVGYAQPVATPDVFMRYGKGCAPRTFHCWGSVVAHCRQGSGPTKCEKGCNHSFSYEVCLQRDSGARRAFAQPGDQADLKHMEMYQRRAPDAEVWISSPSMPDAEV